MDSFDIFGRLKNSDIVKNVFCYDNVASTNDIAKEAARNDIKDCCEFEGKECGSLFVAQTQSAGRGRRGRSWVSDAGGGVFMSLLLKPEIKPESVSMLTLVAAVALMRAINGVSGATCKIKWPNDIVLNNRKLSGILTEAAFNEGKTEYVVIGIGINVNIEEFPEDLSKTATSIKRELGVCCDKAEIIASFVHEFSRAYVIFLQTQDMTGLLAEYNEGLVNVDRYVRVLGGVTEAKEGIAVGIDKSGALLVKNNDGNLEHIVAGEVSVRGLYNYV